MFCLDWGLQTCVERRDLKLGIFKEYSNPKWFVHNAKFMTNTKTVEGRKNFKVVQGRSGIIEKQQNRQHYS